MYAERPSRVRGAVLWSSRDELPARVLPDGCMDLLWDGRSLQVAGPDTHAFLTRQLAPLDRSGLRLAPGQAPRLLGVPAHALRDQRVELAELWSPADAEPWVQRLAAADRPGEVLEDLAHELARTAPGADPTVEAIAGRMADAAPVRATAATLGLSERQLHRRSLDAFGYGPKLLAKILRLQRALTLAHRGEPLAQVAAAAGYYDQPHLARDVHQLAGVPLGELVA
jgi:AraC-like DNA-binding protein